MYFQNYRLQKMWLNKSLKSRFSGPFRKHHVSEPNTVEIWIATPLSYLLITVKAIKLENKSFSDMESLKNVC